MGLHFQYVSVVTEVVLLFYEVLFISLARRPCTHSNGSTVTLQSLQAGLDGICGPLDPDDTIGIEASLRLLVVEDDNTIRDFLSRALLQTGFRVDVCAHGKEAESLAVEGTYDAMVVDLTLPDMDGLDLIQRLRGQGVNAPVLILSARRSLDERILGLERGGDDYLTKPFAVAEVLARLRALLRRSTPGQQEATRLRVADLELDLIRRQAWRGDTELQLTQQEFALLEYLCRNAGRVVTRAMVLDHVWKMRIDTSTNIVDVHIHRLRAKVDREAERPLIRTMRGVGYVLKD